MGSEAGLRLMGSGAGHGAGLRLVRDEGTAEKKKNGVQTGPHSKMHHKTKQTKNSKQANKKNTKTPKDQGGGPVVHCLPRPWVPSQYHQMRKTKRKSNHLSRLSSKGLYRELFIHFNFNIPAINSITQ